MVTGRVTLEYAADPPHFVRMPNFLSVATHPFDPQHYEEDEDDEQAKLDDEGRTRLKLRVCLCYKYISSNIQFLRWKIHFAGEFAKMKMEKKFERVMQKL